MSANAKIIIVSTIVSLKNKSQSTLEYQQSKYIMFMLPPCTSDETIALSLLLIVAGYMLKFLFVLSETKN